VLVLQGVLDPLNDAQGRADLLEERLQRACKVCLKAGHCPHDEVPELVNAAIDEFVQECAGMYGKQVPGDRMGCLESEETKLKGASIAV
jgi:hypothetical protein